MRALIVPGTNRIAYEILRSAYHIRGVHVFGGGFDSRSAEKMPYEDFFLLPAINSLHFNQILDLVSRINADLIFLAHDEWLLKFKGVHRIGKARVAISSEKSIKTSSFKLDTYTTFRSYVRTPEIYGSIDEVYKFPIFIKPNRGQGSHRTVK